MRTIDQLIAATRLEAERAPFPVDQDVYARAGKDPLQPILFGGSLDAPVCIFARDLGKDEVARGEPLVGAGGRLVRAGLHADAHGEPPPKSDRTVETALRLALLANTVPYKPPGNKAYAGAVKERFRPFLEELLVGHWTGHHLLTLGTEAFEWFAPYLAPGLGDAFWSREDRYESDLECVLTAEIDGTKASKPITIAPLPHPSPLNQKWHGRFPALLAARLASARKKGS
ncbi:uracil-DNA glycosylase family protein [Tundrisphaera sp. TA3]|uniref:uracil-DNA glycosylase family protein n=1 Tax=Tundrisphaera sp. TA3 TaxID=3435775 RepID=UPI003EBC5FB5